MKNNTRFSICLLFLWMSMSFCLAAETYSQETFFTIESNNLTVKEVFNKIEKESEYIFFYLDNSVDLNRKVSVKARKEQVSKILDQIFEGTDTHYYISDRQIIISKDEKAAPVSLQQKGQTITGIVKDATGEPVIGANIVEKGTTNGTITDMNGQFTLTVNPKAVLQISYIGFNTLDMPVGNKSSLTIKLTEDTKALDEVVVVGYGVMRKSDLTGSVGSVKSDVIQKQAISSFDQGLQGKVAGVQVMATSGSPGGVVDIRIRGGNSLTSGNQPLYVIDGYPVTAGGSAGGSGAGQNPLATLNPGDIESMEILKDASATSIYGSRGANGVILITTKRGKQGKTTVTYDGYVGFQHVAKKLDMMNATEWAEMANEGATTDGRPIYYPSASPNPLYPAVDQLGEGTNYQDLIFRSAPIHSHNVSVNGGSENTKFSVVASYFAQDGVVKNQDFNRVSLRNNIDTKISKIVDLSTSFTVSRVFANIGRENGDGGGNTSVINAALVLPPTVPVRDPETGDFIRMNYLSGSSAVPNPVPYVEYLQDKGTIDRILASADLTFHIIDGLTLKVSGGADMSSALREVYEPKETNTGYNANGIAQQQNRRSSSYSNENILTYIKKFGVHSLNVMVGSSLLYEENKTSSMTARDFISDVYGYNNLDAGAQWDKPNTGRSKSTLLSGFGRVNYVLMDKYLFTVTGRADGSSKFGTNNKWAFFPSFAAAWRINQEKFMKEIDWISNLKIRGSWGVTGNQNISSYSSQEKMNTYVYPIGGVTSVGIGAGNMPNPNLKWETTAITDIGLDFGVLNNRINFTADYYYKKTTDLLWNISVPLTTGFGTVLKNIGSLENKGLELSVSADVLTGQFKWNTMINWSTNKNKVLEIPGYIPTQQGTISGHLKVNGSWLEPGLPVGVWNLLKTNGVMRTEKEWQDAARVADSNFDKIGDMSFVDKNGDGKISFGEDRQIVGDPNPDFIFGWTNNFSYKNFDLSIYINGSVGNDIYNVLRAETNIVSTWGNQRAEVMDRWTANNPNGKYPRAHVLVNQNLQQSDFLIEDGSFLRVQNVTLGYTFPKVSFLRSLRVYATAQNLLTITGYSGFNPEVNSQGQSNLQMGVDYNAYPTARSFILGVNIGF